MKKNAEWICKLSFVVVFSIFIIWIIPDKAYLLISAYIAVAIALILGRASGIDEKKDERTIHIATLGARNAFIFMIFAFPYLGLFIMLGLLVIDTVLLMIILYFSMLAVAWMSIG